DRAAQPGRRNNPSLEVKILRNDAGVPRAARSRHQAGDEIGKDAGEDEMTPAIPGAESEDLRGFLQFRRDGHGAGNDIEEDVPLRAEEHEEHSGNFKTPAKAKQQEKNDREEDRR